MDEIKTAPPVEKPGYFVFSNNEELAEKATASIAGYRGVSVANRMGFSPIDIGGTGISGRYGMGHREYETFRPDEQTTFRSTKQMILYADYCYRRHGIVRNIIDIMGDFGSHGIRIVHRNEKEQAFFQRWFKKVGGPLVSERFMNYLYRMGNVVVKKRTARIPKKLRESFLATAASNPDMNIEERREYKWVIPWRYNFLHPATVALIGGSLANFSGRKRYAIKIPYGLRNLMNNYDKLNAIQKQMIDDLPPDIKKAAETNQAIPLDEEKVSVFHYKKDDWQEWADPMITSIALDISLYEKLKLCDRSALDGAISNIRLWNLGNIDAKMFPNEAALAAFSEVLESNTQAGTIDLVVGPDVTMTESKTAVHQFLGLGKYEPALNGIYGGLGVPQTLTGTFGSGGTTNNFVSLKTLTQRLEYGRDQLVAFWEEEIEAVQKAMGFDEPARIEFGMMNLGDEVAEKALLIQLADRNIISEELLNEYFGSDPEMERVRTVREDKQREDGNRVEKAGAFHQPQHEYNLSKVFAQTGAVTPSQLGVELLPNKKGEKSALEMRQKQAGEAPKGQSGQGRPKNSKDSQKRKTKDFRPLSKGTLEVWAKKAHDSISEMTDTFFLSNFNITDKRKLTADQVIQMENDKAAILFNLAPFSEITPENVYNALREKYPQKAISYCREREKEISRALGLPLSLEDRRQIQAQVYSELYENL